MQAFTLQVLLLGFPNPQLGPFETAGLVLAGGLTQTLLLGMVWLASPRQAERNAVASAYKSLAVFVASLASGGGRRVPSVLEWHNAQMILAEAQRLGARPEHLTLLQALRLGEGLHAALVGFAQADALVRQTGVAGEQQANVTLKLLEGMLEEVVHQVKTGHALNFLLEGLDNFERAVFALEDWLPATRTTAHQEYVRRQRAFLWCT